MTLNDYFTRGGDQVRLAKYLQFVGSPLASRGCGGNGKPVPRTGS
ncbi:hypothetical protein [Streptomyces sp.]|jgi:hypothetical protein|nr:hypothetical protein [Streptomyces sp.]